METVMTQQSMDDGAVELTVALHYVFNTPEDQLVWDVGHQAYPHKILTGRKERMPTIRTMGGSGLMTEYGAERALRDSMAGTIYSGTSDMQRNIIAGWLGIAG